MINSDSPTLEELSTGLGFIPITEEIRTKLQALDPNNLDKATLPFIPALFDVALETSHTRLMTRARLRKTEIDLANPGKTLALKDYLPDMRKLLKERAHDLTQTYVQLLRNLILSLQL